MKLANKNLVDRSGSTINAKIYDNTTYTIGAD